MTRQTKANLALLAVAFVWGATFVVIQGALDDITPHYFNFIRFSIAVAFLALVFRGRLRNINQPTLKVGIFIGIFLFSGYAFQTVGLQYTTASNAGFITGLSVVLVPMLSAIILRHLPTVFAVLGVVSATIGLALLTLSNGLQHLNYGDILVFFCAVSFGLHIVMVGKYAPHYDSVLLALIQIATVAVASLFFGVFSEPLPQVSSFTQPVWIALLLTAIPATALAFLIQNTVQKFTSPTHTAIIFSMEPVFAALTAFLVIGEILTSIQLIGCVLILLGMLVAELKGGTVAESENRGHPGGKRPTGSSAST